MNTLLDGLRAYFENNTQEKIKEDWAKLSKYDSIGISINEFIEKNSFSFQKGGEINWRYNYINEIKNPEFTSDFLFCVC